MGATATGSWLRWMPVCVLFQWLKEIRHPYLSPREDGQAFGQISVCPAWKLPSEELCGCCPASRSGCDSSGSGGLLGWTPRFNLEKTATHLPDTVIKQRRKGGNHGGVSGGQPCPAVPGDTHGGGHVFKRMLALGQEWTLSVMWHLYLTFPKDNLSKLFLKLNFSGVRVTVPLCLASE